MQFRQTEKGDCFQLKYRLLSQNKKNIYYRFDDDAVYEITDSGFKKVEDASEMVTYQLENPVQKKINGNNRKFKPVIQITTEIEPLNLIQVELL